MSYILEALKKAQTERQLGSAPTIHALPIHAAPPQAARSAQAPLWIACGVLVLLAAGAAAMWWRQTPPAPVVVAGAPAPQVVVVGPAVAPAVSTVVVAPNQAVLQAPAILPAPQAQVSAPVIAPPPVEPRAVAALPVAPAPVARPAPPPKVAPAVVAAPAPATAPEPPPEESLPFMQNLPEAVRSGLPQVVFGGYMYSKNPADRLLLIDKTLRHEGEEVAPGLFLEKLLPKAAVMNFRGVRYRVSYN